jgi:large subunit ribosomal protein L19
MQLIKILLPLQPKSEDMDLVKKLESTIIKADLPEFAAGDNVTVHYKIKEGNKERIQPFQGTVIQRRGNGSTETFTVRKMSSGIGVERIFPVNSPLIEKIVVNRRGKVRRARIFYLRDRTGKKARIKEKRV